MQNYCNSLFYVTSNKTFAPSKIYYNTWCSKKKRYNGHTSREEHEGREDGELSVRELELCHHLSHVQEMLLKQQMLKTIQYTMMI